MTDTLKAKTAALRRAHVLDAAAAVFAARGYHQSTVRDVAREAGVADGTIYNVFANKAALLDGLLERLAEASAAPPHVAPDADLETLLRDVLTARWAEHTDAVGALVRVVLAEALVDAELRAAFLAKAIAPTTAPLAGVLEGRTGDVPADLASRIAVATFLGAQVLRLLGDEVLAKRSDEAPAAIAAILARGLAGR